VFFSVAAAKVMIFCAGIDFCEQRLKSKLVLTTAILAAIAYTRSGTDFIDDEVLKEMMEFSLGLRYSF